MIHFIKLYMCYAIKYIDKPVYCIIVKSNSKLPDLQNITVQYNFLIYNW